MSTEEDNGDMVVQPNPMQGVFVIPPLQPLNTEADMDLTFIRRVVTITLSVTMIIATGYIAAVILSDGAILLRPSENALERHEIYRNLVNEPGEDLSGSGVTVCIVDSGISTEHSDLDTMNLKSWKDFVNDRDTPYDDHGHGTSMAGILVANGWLKGVAPQVNLLVAKALSKDGQGDDGVVAEAIDWCATNGAHIISLSLGGAPNVLPFSITGGRTSGDAANEAIDSGIYVIAAAGNDGGEDDDGDVASPSSEAGVISVGGVTHKGNSWAGSSEGDNNGRLVPLLFPRNDPHKKPEVVAPAQEVPILMTDGGWGLADGTSAATVYVAGAIALVLEAHPNLMTNGSQGNADDIDQMKNWLMNSVRPQQDQTGHDDRYGYGLLDIEALIAIVDS